MSTSTFVQDDRDDPVVTDTTDAGSTSTRSTSARPGTRVRLGRVGLALAGVIALLASAWGGVVPYVGPLFGYSADGSDAWHWSLPHAFLALVPGVVGVLLGLMIVAESRGITVGKGRVSLATAGTLLMVCGAWFAIGPLGVAGGLHLEQWLLRGHLASRPSGERGWVQHRHRADSRHLRRLRGRLGVPPSAGCPDALSLERHRRVRDLNDDGSERARQGR